MIRFGVVGCGGVAHWHIEALQKIQDARLVAVCDSDIARARGIADKFGGIVAFFDGEALIQSGLVDAVCICTPSGTHADLVIQALRYGLHVAAEKPLAITRSSLKDVLLAEAECGKKLMTISQMRYGQDIGRVKDLVRNGALGRITMVDLSMKYYREPSYYSDSNWRGTLSMDGGGALMNQGIHGLDLMRYLCGEVESVRCVHKTLVHCIEAEDTLAATMTLKNGALCVLSATTSCYPGHDRRLEIFGSEGSLTLIEDSLASLVIKGQKTYTATLRGEYNGASDPFAMGCELHRRQLSDFVDSIVNNAASPVDGKDAAATLNIVFALYESAASGAQIQCD